LAKQLDRASGHGSIRQLSFLVEILGTKPLPGSIELISYLLQVLSNIVQNLSPTEAEVNYTEQLLMSAVESAASRVSVSSFSASLPFLLIVHEMAGCSQPVADGYSC
jgi:U3 small nucleolar RNA-associated protein 10